jgi:DNA mismatch repair protein MutS2
MKGKTQQHADIAIGNRILVRRPGKRSPAAREIDMHGLRVEDMLPRLDQFLSDAMLERVSEVRIVHGHGTGALRKAIHQRLIAIGIRHFRLGEPGQTPGGDGVTIVTL